MSTPLLTVEGLSKHFPISRGLFQRKAGVVRAVNGVSLHIDQREVLGLVGESGSGKSTLGRMILRLIEPDQGHVSLDGVDVTALGARDLRRMRRRMQMVFQDPNSSLNPRMTIGAALREALTLHGLAAGREDARIAELLDMVELPKDSALRWPREFSGGQRQRIGLVRALAVEPDLIIADEPVSALDVSVQAQIMKLMGRLQSDLKLTMLFITHDLDVVEYLADRIVVMYLGRIVETARTEDLFARPHHPYTKALLEASPKPDPQQRLKRFGMLGSGAPPAAPEAGCAFQARCPKAGPECALSQTPLRAIAENHLSACIRD
jgi:oligopeptide/dipeptide ABC transporter ATP-binding protein